MKRLTAAVICSAWVWGGMVWGDDLPTLERGRALFSDIQLGTTGKSCATCHPDGKKFKMMGSTDSEEIAATINACIAGPLKGKKLDLESVEMKSLVLYLKSLAGGDK